MDSDKREPLINTEHITDAMWERIRRWLADHTIMNCEESDALRAVIERRGEQLAEMQRHRDAWRGYAYGTREQALRDGFTPRDTEFHGGE